jgi:hypothetical protein
MIRSALFIFGNGAVMMFINLAILVGCAVNTHADCSFKAFRVVGE